MQLRYEGGFLEAAVFLGAGGRRKVPGLQIARFHREREGLYRILDPEDRDAAFFKLHLDWFREWGLERPLIEALKTFPLIQQELTFLAVRGSSNSRDEGAELYVNETGQRNGLLSLNSRRFGDEAALQVYLRHEFTHLHDMLDVSFGYNPALELPGLNSAQMQVARERYRLLWDITIDGRTATAGLVPTVARQQHLTAFSRAYAFWPESRVAEVFNSLWQNPTPHHADLLALIADPRGLRNVRGPVPGASCSLCGFPTHAWAASDALSLDLVQRITTEFPTWHPEEGLCGRCLEAYQAAGNAPLAFAR